MVLLECNCTKCFAAIVCVSGLQLYSMKGTEFRSPVNNQEKTVLFTLFLLKIIALNYFTEQ